MPSFMDILKRAWGITWNHKKLWWLGLFAYGLASGSSNGASNTSYSTETQDWSDLSALGSDIFAPLEGVSESLIAVTFVLLILFAVLALAWWVASLAARAGLVRLADDAEEGRAVVVGDGWRQGFALWGRMFGIDLLLFLPMALILGLGGLAVWGAIEATGGLGGDQARDLFSGLMSICGVIVFFILFALLLKALLDVIRALAERHAVLDELTFVESMKAAWTTLTWRTKDILLMWLVLFAVSLAYGTLVGIVSVMMFLPLALGIGAFGTWGVLMIFPVILLLMAPAAVYNTFRSAAWTVFFRGLKGRYETDA